MHLLRRVKGDHPQLVWFPDKPPKYAILSHRWVDDEPTFQDFVKGEASRRDGFKKIIFCEKQAAKDEIDYFWVDTVCINKESSAELNEALNSMFRWYKESAKCYVFMPDVTTVEEDFRQSCWFERGWTLQELIAPPILEFYNKDEKFLGTKVSLEGQVSAITGVPGSALRGEALTKFSIPERLSWVKNRITTREEDKAYCLLGIFGIHMPVIYGEKENAFIRLMEEIERRLTGLHNLQTFSSIRQKLYNTSGDIMSPIDYTPPTTPPMTPPLNETPRSDDEYLSIKHALFASDVQTRHEQIKSFESSQWLFDHPTFQAWIKGDRIEDKILTLRGNPGTGKSVLIKEASKRAEDQRVLVLRHYFNRSHHSKTKQLTSPLEEFCTSLLYQVLDSLEPRPWGFIKKWTEILRHRPGEKPWGLPQLQDAISEIVTTQNFKIAKVRIFIDALEESCDDEGGIGASQPLDILSFASRLLKAATSAGVDLKICVARQHLPTFGELEPKTLSIIVEDHNRPALEAFVSEELKRVEHPVLRPLLYQKIVSRCTNDFLWTTAVIEDVLANTKSSKEKDVFNAIDELPRTHKEMYQRILQNEMPSKQKNTVQLLQIVSGARRSMTVNEFRHALAFITEFAYDDIEQWERSEDGFLTDELFENYVRRESLGLIEIHDATDAQDFVRFIHGSVDLFLRDPSSVLPSDVSPWSECSHLALFSMCLRALNFSSLRKEEPIAFVEYASEHWLYHGRDAGVRIQEIEDLPDFLTNCSKRKTKRIIEKQIVALKQSQDRVSNLIEDDESLLVLLASTGCTYMLERHLAGCSACQEACSTYDPSYRKALSNALIGRWTNTALLLFQKHGDGDAGINNLFESRTLLYRACYFDQTEVVAFLLERGADPLVHSPWGYEYPLHVTIALAREKTMNVLLQHGKVEEQFKLQRKEASCRGCTALHMALRGRQPQKTKVAVLKWLLKKAPKRIGILDIRDEEGVSVLDLARQMKTDGLPGAEDLDDEIQDFFDQYET